jgi:hypothetical protein
VLVAATITPKSHDHSIKKFQDDQKALHEAKVDTRLTRGPNSYV